MELTFAEKLAVLQMNIGKLSALLAQNWSHAEFKHTLERLAELSDDIQAEVDASKKAAA